MDQNHRMLRASSLAVFVTLLLGIAGCGGSASVEPGLIVFSARPDAADASGWQLFVMNGDGSGLRRLTHTDGDTWPVWSPDGTQVAFDRCCGSQAGTWLIDWNGENERRLPVDGRGYTWSPDGKEIAFTRKVGEDSSEIAVANIDGTNERTLVSNASAPVWSPHGDLIALERGELYEERIYVMRADGSDVTSVTKGPGDSCAEWSPDGKRIAFCSGRDGEVYVVNADGSGLRRVSATTTSDSGFVIPFPAWSPDGRRLVFSTLGPRESEVIVVVDADGTDQRTLSPLGAEYITDKNPAWSPDGAEIVFVNGEAGLGGELWVMNADGTHRRRFTRGPFTEPDQGLDWATASQSD